MIKPSSDFNPETRINLVNHLSEFLLEKRLEQLKTVHSKRTRYITVVLENIFQPHNASAVLRSCECFGVQDIHIIENYNSFRVSPDVVLGANKWLNIHRYNEYKNNSLSTIQSLKERGYRIVATSPHANQNTPENFDIEKGKFALFFGTELKGLSTEVMENADEFLLIPTVGFTESLNISVSAAICLFSLTQRLIHSSIDIALPSDEANELMHDWLRKSVKSWRSIEKRFLAKK